MSVEWESGLRTSVEYDCSSALGTPTDVGHRQIYDKPMGPSGGGIVSPSNGYPNNIKSDEWMTKFDERMNIAQKRCIRLAVVRFRLLKVAHPHVGFAPTASVVHPTVGFVYLA